MLTFLQHCSKLHPLPRQLPSSRKDSNPKPSWHSRLGPIGRCFLQLILILVFVHNHHLNRCWHRGYNWNRYHWRRGSQHHQRSRKDHQLQPCQHQRRQLKSGARWCTGAPHGLLAMSLTGSSSTDRGRCVHVWLRGSIRSFLIFFSNIFFCSFLGLAGLIPSPRRRGKADFTLDIHLSMTNVFVQSVPSRHWLRGKFNFLMVCV